jgi:hypothetical protein
MNSAGIQIRMPGRYIAKKRLLDLLLNRGRVVRFLEEQEP